MEQEYKIMEEFVQEFRKAVRDIKYKWSLLIKEFKSGINKIIRRKLIKIEYLQEH